MIMKRVMMICVASLMALLFAACGSKPEPVIYGLEKRHFDKLKMGLRPALWEDGFRTDLEPGKYEWWYFDAHLDDGTVVVIVFMSRPYVDIKGEAVPVVNVRVTTPDGIEHKSTVKIPKDSFRASRDRCDVKIGKSWMTGDLKRYRIHVETKRIGADILLEGVTPAWRPATGYCFFGKEEEKYFAWLAAVPYGRVTGELSVNGARRTIRGSGYHDHNWGNIELVKIMNNWWWSRAQFGDYTIITSEMTATERYGRLRIPVFLLANRGTIILEDSRNMKLLRYGAALHPVSGKPVENRLSFVYADPGNGVTADYTLERKKDILVFDLLRMVPSWKAFAARCIGVRPWYHRIQGDATLDLDIKGKKESMKAGTVYELMYLGKAVMAGD